METPRRLGGTELEKINAVTERIIGSAIEVHSILGPGLLEDYDTALCIEFDERGIKYARQVRIPAYKGRSLGNYLVDFTSRILWWSRLRAWLSCCRSTRLKRSHICGWRRSASGC